MAWMQKLTDTYERCKGIIPAEGEPALEPIAHSTQNAHVEVVIDGDGHFIGAKSLDAVPTLIPMTEDSASRSGKEPAPHPLCDKLKYCAGDYVPPSGKPSLHAAYLAQLADWAASEHSHPKVRAVHACVVRGTLLADLARTGALESRTSRTKTLETEELVVRWRVEIPGTVESATWEDKDLIESWIAHYCGQTAKRGLCCIRGEEGRLSDKHPKYIRRPGDGAKLISSNDKDGFTYRGRFEKPEQAVTIGFDASQKAHSALRWLIRRQGTHVGGQTVVAWAVSGEPIPDPVSDTLALCGVTVEGETQGDDPGDVGQTDSLLLGKAMRGYRAKLDPADDVVVMALEAATPGRMAIGFYRELKGSAFLDRIEMWHRRYCWHQTLGWRDGPAGKKVPRRFVGAPAPKHITEIAFGRALQDTLLGATVQRLLPCIVDGRPVPEDLLRAAIRRTCARNGLGDLEFETCLGVTCALFRGTHHERKYAMALEEDRTTRDYLFGRLLAVAERIEEAALHVATEKARDTAAAKLMQRFAERPASTWKMIELALPPYRSRLRANRPDTLVHLDKVLDTIMVVLPPEDFVDRPLGGEFLLGYHCQRHALFQKVNKDPQPADTQPSAPVLTEGSPS